MSLAIDQLSLGQIGTNCYLVRADRDATEAVVIDPGDEPAEIERALAVTRRGLRRDPAHAQPLRPLRRARRAGRVDRRARSGCPRASSTSSAGPRRFFPGYPTRAYTGDATLLSGGETVDAAGISFQVRHVPGHSPGPPLLLRRRGALLRRRSLLRLASGGSTCPSATGRRCSRRSARSRTPTRPRRSSSPGTARRRRSATSSRATRSSPSFARDQDRAAARARTTSFRPSSRSGGASPARWSG